MYLSDFDRMKEKRLPNWARYSKSGMPSGDAAIASIYHRGKADRNPGVDEKLEYSGTHEETPKIDADDALLIDGYLTRLGPTSSARRALCDAYYRNLPVGRMRLDAAIRTLLDLIDGTYANISCNPRYACYSSS